MRSAPEIHQLLDPLCYILVPNSARLGRPSSRWWVVATLHPTESPARAVQRQQYTPSQGALLVDRPTSAPARPHCRGLEAAQVPAAADPERRLCPPPPQPVPLPWIWSPPPPPPGALRTCHRPRGRCRGASSRPAEDWRGCCSSQHRWALQHPWLPASPSFPARRKLRLRGPSREPH